MRWKTSQMPTMRLKTATSVMSAPMVEKIAASNGVAMLKWLVVPRTTCRMMSTISTIKAKAVTLAAACTQRRRPCTNISSHKRVAA